MLLVLLLSACGGKMESSESSSATSDSSEKDSSAIADFEDGSKFADFDGETQLAIVFATLNDIVLVYDYGTGEAEAQLKSEMTQDEIDKMKKSAESMASQQDKLKKASDESLAQLDNFKEKAKAEEEIAGLKQVYQDFLDVSKQMLDVFAQVTPENAAASRTTVDELKVQYLAKAEGIMTASKKIIQVAGLDEEKFMNIAIYIIDNVAKK